MTKVQQASQFPIVYVTRDIERALAMPKIPGKTAIITNVNQTHELPAEYPLIEIPGTKLLDSRELLQNTQTVAYINKLKEACGGVNIVVFKSSVQIERTCAKHGWNLLNNSSLLTNEIENKVSGVYWLGELGKLLPPHSVQILKNVTWASKPFILQFNRAHTGQGTMLISSEADLHKLQETFPEREVRVTTFIDGPMFTSNNIVHANGVLVGNVSYQITGIKPFTDNPFATIGNDWGLAHKLFDDSLQEQHRAMVELVGEKLRFAGYKGLFGIDMVLDEKEHTLMLIEINARQPASTTFESTLQHGLTTFAAHIQALLGKAVTAPLAKITAGSQIIIRTTVDRKSLTMSRVNELANKYAVRLYTNEKPGADLLRIMWPEGSMMKDHAKLSDAGLATAKLTA